MLAVAANEANIRLLEDFLVDATGTVQIVTDVAEFDDAVDLDDPPPLAIVDIDGYGREVWELIERLGEAGVPVIVLARYRTQEVQQATLKYPVRTVLEKPVRKAQLKAIVDTLTG